MKALDILQRFSDRCESALGFNGEYVATLLEINEAIVELEAKLSNTEQLTCDGCDKLEFCAILRNLDHVGYTLNRGIFKCTFFKPKDTQ